MIQLARLSQQACARAGPRDTALPDRTKIPAVANVGAPRLLAAMPTLGAATPASIPTTSPMGRNWAEANALMLVIKVCRPPVPSSDPVLERQTVLLTLIRTRT
eukprot:scaffold1074_cov409-Prasinococcus_capsulatus_cf.AAC.13